ncbi:dihydroneopterin aldolase [Mucilaginibacter gynuensis]|uniref:7,8-dihydroneopterin aldolase n=1 Tax=Mucilaginibacter gynuensis TaxID=1302236 RepID=A0ABP8H406_9SPHI
MITVALHGAEFFAYHGFYAEEQVIGNKFLVDVTVQFLPQGDLNGDEMANTVNYEHVYKICCEEMKHPRKLIETVAQAIVDKIKADYPFAESITLTLKKQNPPMKGKVEYSAVTITL